MLHSMYLLLLLVLLSAVKSDLGEIATQSKVVMVE